MRLPFLTILVVLGISLVVDWYIYVILKKRTKTIKCPRVHLCISLALLLCIIVGVSIPRRSGSDDVFMNIMWILYGYATVLLPKIAFVLVDLLASVPCLWKGKRSRFLSWSGVVFSIIAFLVMWWGALVNRYDVEIVNQDIVVDNLPEDFDGYRIVQISDLHVGTFDGDTTFLGKSVNMINSTNPDIVVFTGDIVNRRADELKPYIKVLSGIKSRDGVYSILGNHDYGDYVNWADSAAKADNLQKLKNIQAVMGWKLLLNENKMLYRGNDSIALIGVENWGDPPFTVYGDLKKSYSTLNDSVVKILLTHNPAHWVAEVADSEDCNIALTLAGHTHAMQISICGISPAKWRYDTWGGEYRDKTGKCVLYVNIGLGTVGIPTRIGANPEITVFTLHGNK